MADGLPKQLSVSELGQLSVNRRRELLLRHHRDFIRGSFLMLLSARAAGDVLLFEKNEAGHGNWLTSSFLRGSGLDGRTAQRYMQIAGYWEPLLALLAKERGWAKTTCVSDLEILVELLQDVSLNRALSLILKYRIKIGDLSRRKTSSASRGPADEQWLTPSPTVKAVQAFHGTIDLDPCAEETERPHIPARFRYTRANDALPTSSPWNGKVFANPGSDRHASLWIGRACYEFAEKRTVSEATLLLPATSDAKWLQYVARFPRAFIRQRQSVVFLTSKSRRRRRLPFALMVILLAPHERWDAFAAIFSPIADVFLPWNQPNS
ncbi:MAG TPA: DNA N-6-adenine-methyltransferase [Pirellulales bacterium]|nr:DNA N-6-adenine-methyltransferase [Pirellulales bacterium]